VRGGMGSIPPSDIKKEKRKEEHRGGREEGKELPFHCPAYRFHRPNGEEKEEKKGGNLRRKSIACLAGKGE